jgi:hypothetical protein
MFYFRLLILFVFTIVGIGCASDPELAGTYVTEVSQSSDKTVFVGELQLDQRGTYHATIGLLEFNGTWRTGNGNLYLTGTGENRELLPYQYRVDRDRLIAQFEGVDSKNWRFVRRDSQAVANR